jgi:transcription elongation factor Elf1
MVSNLDKMFYPFQYTRPECGHKFQALLRDLIEAEVIFCPKCGVSQNLKVSKATGDLGSWLNVAGELDKIERFEKGDKPK